MSRTIVTRLVLVIAFGFLNLGLAFGDQPSQVGVALDQLDHAINQDSSLNVDTKSALTNLSEALRAESTPSATSFENASYVTEASLETVSLNLGGGCDCSCGAKGCETCLKEMKLPGNTCVLGFFGDFRLRHESQFYTGPSHNRHRERLRFRFGANFQLSDQLLVSFRARTGDPTDPNSPHYTFGSTGFHSLEFNLDRAYAQYDPCWLPGLSVLGGKVPHRFATNPVYSELVWDADINPEGLELVYESGGFFRFVAGGYVIEERNGAATYDESSLLTFQFLGRQDLGNCSSVEASVGYYYYNELTPAGAGTLLGENRGNATAGAFYASDFGIWNGIVAYKYDGGCVPVVFSGEYIHNHRAFNNQDTGWAAGVAFGEASGYSGRKVFYQYQDIEQEAVFSPFVNDDFPYATNYRGHVMGMDQKLGKATTLRLWALNSERNVAAAGFTDSSRWTCRADINIKF